MGDQPVNIGLTVRQAADLRAENRALRELFEWALLMIDGHVSDLQGLRESVSEQASKIALDRLSSAQPLPGEQQP